MFSYVLFLLFSFSDPAFVSSIVALVNLYGLATHIDLFFPLSLLAFLILSAVCRLFYLFLSIDISSFNPSFFSSLNLLFYTALLHRLFRFWVYFLLTSVMFGVTLSASLVWVLPWVPSLVLRLSEVHAFSGFGVTLSALSGFGVTKSKSFLSFCLMYNCWQWWYLPL